MREFRTFLSQQVLFWLVPMVLFFGFLILLAWKLNEAPASPVAYEVF